MDKRYEEKVLSYFRKISAIPRASGDEKAISDYIADFAKERGLDVQRDEYYNMIIRKPATVKNAGKPVILQGHLDMVYIKEDTSDHVYENGITVLEDEEFYYADQTSLGADNGIAIAYCLALLDSDDLAHPDLEVVLTAQEEVGLVGASQMDLSSLKGNRFINLDSEEEGIFYIGCAGGLRSQMTWKISEETAAGERIPITVAFHEMSGGHSGDQIGNGLGNAIVLLGRLLYGLREYPVRIGDVDAPGKANAIANRAKVTLYVRPEDEEKVLLRIRELEETFRQELQYTDNLRFELKMEEAKDRSICYSEKLQERLVKALCLIPDGVAGYSFAMEGLVETSMNMGALTREGDELVLIMSLRSSVESRKYQLRDKIQIISDAYADGCEFQSDYPGWQCKQNSKLQDTAVALYEEMFNKEAQVAAIHAGLECGYWDYKRPGMEILSIGPDMFDVHSTKEKVSKESVVKTWRYLVELMERLA